MRWIIVLVVVLVVAGAGVGGFWYFSAKEEQIVKNTEMCIASQTHMQKFVEAWRSGDAAMCRGLDGQVRQRCLAYTLNDVSLCGEDKDCIAITTKNTSLCIEPMCKALAASDTAYCQELEEESQDWCENLVNRNVNFFASNEQLCRAVAEEII